MRLRSLKRTRVDTFVSAEVFHVWEYTMLDGTIVSNMGAIKIQFQLVYGMVAEA